MSECALIIFELKIDAPDIGADDGDAQFIVHFLRKRKRHIIAFQCGITSPMHIGGTDVDMRLRKNFLVANFLRQFQTLYKKLGQSVLESNRQFYIGRFRTLSTRVSV